MVTTIVNAIEFAIFIGFGIGGIIACYATVILVFRRRRQQGMPLPLAALVALLLGFLMVGFWPIYGAYWLWKRRAPPRASASTP